VVTVAGLGSMTACCWLYRMYSRATYEVTCAYSVRVTGCSTFQHISVSKRARRNCLWTSPSPLCSAVLHSQLLCLFPQNCDNGCYDRTAQLCEQNCCFVCDCELLQTEPTLYQCMFLPRPDRPRESCPRPTLGPDTHTHTHTIR
jgi:hypothetical protein